MQQSLLFIGLGVMGFPMAGHLSHRFTTWVYNRSPAKTEDWLAQHTGERVRDLGTLPTSITCIITCVGNDEDLRALYLGETGLFRQAQVGTLFIDHTTASATVARELAAAANAANMCFLDAPVSGGQQGAINGQLTVMCGGSESTYERAKVFLDCYSQSHKRLGETGAGQLTKMCNQIAVAGVIQGLAESLHFAEQAGLDRQAVIDVIAKGAAQSWQMDNRHRSMIAGDYNHGFAVDLMRKDLSIVLNQARHLDARLPATALIDQFYADVQAMGGQRWDTSSLLERLRNQG